MARTVRLTRKKNPGDELPYGKWIPVHGVKFHENGKVELMTESQGNRLPNLEGYRDSSGVFHPIRWDPHYDPERTASEDAEYEIHPSSKFYKRTGLFPPKRKKRVTGKRRR